VRPGQGARHLGLHAGRRDQVRRALLRALADSEDQRAVSHRHPDAEPRGV